MRTSTLRWFFIMPTLSAAFVLIVYVTFLLAWPPRSITNATMRVLDEDVDVGGVVRFDVSLCKHTDQFSEIHYGLRGLDGTRRYYDAGMEYGTNPKGCIEITQHFHVPSDVPPGMYEVLVQANIRLNALRTDSFEMRPGVVCVRPRADGGCDHAESR